MLGMTEVVITLFLRNCFVSQYQKTSFGNSSVLQSFSGIETFWRKWEGRREYHDFPSKICCLVVSRNFVGDPFNPSIVWGMEKFRHKRGKSHFSVCIFLVSQHRNFSRRKQSVLQETSGIEKCER